MSGKCCKLQQGRELGIEKCGSFARNADVNEWRRIVRGNVFWDAAFAGLTHLMFSWARCERRVGKVRRGAHTLLSGVIRNPLNGSDALVNHGGLRRLE